MPTQKLGPWAPDHPELDNPGLLVATNVYPGAGDSYLPVPDLSASTTALSVRPRGAIQAVDTSGTIHQYAGHATLLYRNVGNTWTDSTPGGAPVSGAFSNGADDNWSFVAWENKVLAVNWADDPVQITMGNTAFTSLTTDLKARYIAKIRDFVVMAHTTDATDGDQPGRVRWSAFADEEDWTVSASTLSDFQTLQGGEIRALFGGEYGVVFKRDAVWRMTFIGAPLVFQFDEVLPGIGLLAPGAAAQDGDDIFFLSDKGFYSIKLGSQPKQIGAGSVDRFIATDIDKDHLNRLSSVADPAGQRVFFSYPGSGNNDGRPNKIMVYDRAFEKWSLIEIEHELVWAAGGTGTTLEGLDSVSSSLDALGISLDSSRWVGGAPAIGVFDTLFKSGFLDGSPKTATLTTGDVEFNDGGRSLLTGFRALVRGGSVSAEVGKKNDLEDDTTFGGSLTRRPEGRFTPRVNARYHRLRFTLSGEWEQASGIQIDPGDVKAVGQRG